MKGGGVLLLGRDESIPLMVEMFGQDASMGVRERAGCGLAESGLFRNDRRQSDLPAAIALDQHAPIRVLSPRSLV